MTLEVTQFGSSLPISGGQTQVPYQEFTYTIAAGAYIDIYQVFNYFRVMSLSGGSLALQFGQNGLQTPFSGAGLGIQLFTQVDRVRLVNTGGTSMTITVALALGWINDDRLNVSGTVSISGAVTITSGAVNSTNVALTTFSTSQVSVSSAATQLVTASSTNGLITIEAGSSDIYIGASNAVTTSTGFLIPANGSYTFPIGYKGDVYAIQASGTSTVFVSRGSY